MRVINFDRGSKRRFREIRWSLRERTSIVLLSLFLLAICTLLLLSDLSHEHPLDTVRTIRSNLE